MLIHRETTAVILKQSFHEAELEATQSLRLFSGVNMSHPIELSLEQQFNIRSFETQVEKMDREQAQDFLVKLYRQMVMREATYKELLKHHWGIDGGNWQ
ncbi:hypothetical protein DSM107010_53120 [Chroococcidiopsis cubana SAG 39.79]|nr:MULTISPECIES: NblA/ycf18 family protein [Chroococcidiopsis]RUT06308.1 hypothetical protein DSM107010_53120 [Chroococcidiopsis cubana SAG 39.79]URD50402.1 NblA/ycf18 family protein [Chroococcidiopsis sp. CCNUC1]